MGDIEKENFLKRFKNETGYDFNIISQDRNKDFDSVEIDWYCKGGVIIDQLAN